VLIDPLLRRALEGHGMMGGEGSPAGEEEEGNTVVKEEEHDKDKKDHKDKKDEKGAAEEDGVNPLHHRLDLSPADWARTLLLGLTLLPLRLLGLLATFAAAWVIPPPTILTS
jgi:hypothetical protein